MINWLLLQGGDGAEVATSYSLQEADAKPEALQFCCSRRWIVDVDTPLLVGSLFCLHLPRLLDLKQRTPYFFV